jgi:hypothetical protein
MIWSLENWRTSESVTAGSLIFACECDPAGPRQFARLNDAQRSAICRFLRYFAEADHPDANSDEAQAALRQGWERYCGGEESVGTGAAPAPSGLVRTPRRRRDSRRRRRGR